MKKDIMSKALVLGVIFLFIGVGITSVVDTNSNLSTDNIQHTKLNDFKNFDENGNDWKIVLFTDIDGGFFDSSFIPNDWNGYCPIIYSPSGGSFYLRQGNIHAGWIIGFGFRGEIGLDSPRQGYVEGRLTICLYFSLGFSIDILHFYWKDTLNLYQ